MTEALLLRRSGQAGNDREIIQLLDFMGIAWRPVDSSEILNARSGQDRGYQPSYCAVGSARSVFEALGLKTRGAPGASQFFSNARSVFVFGFEDTEDCQGLLRFLSNDPYADISALSPERTRMSVDDGWPDVCGPMSGIEVNISPRGGDQGFRFSPDIGSSHRIVSGVDGDIFVAFSHSGTRFFLHACRGPVDIRAPVSSRHFDVHRFFCSAVPPVMYLSWAFGDSRWSAPERNACLIIDDPPLRPRYGYLHFSKLLELMKGSRFTTAIAFIPWNWKRIHRDVADMFRERPDHLSILIHGSDHTRGEFATTSMADLNKHTKRARLRMELLRQSTGLTYDPVMVFPQGAFSAEAARVLKLNNFQAAVNTELAPVGIDAASIQIASTWNVANTAYAAFPIFPRRHLSEGLANFAFDILLGKPCFLVAHHEDFRNGGERLARFIDRLNLMPGGLRWRNAAEITKRACLRRADGPGEVALRVFCRETSVINSSPGPILLKVQKLESGGDAIQSVHVDDHPVSWRIEANLLMFEFHLNAGEASEIRIRYLDHLGPARSSPGPVEIVRVGMRRWLSEFRDQNSSRIPLLNAIQSRMRQHLKRQR